MSKYGNTLRLLYLIFYLNVGFADDTVIFGLITDDEAEYHGWVGEFVDWLSRKFSPGKYKKKLRIFDCRA